MAHSIAAFSGTRETRLLRGMRRWFAARRLSVYLTLAAAAAYLLWEIAAARLADFLPKLVGIQISAAVETLFAVAIAAVAVHTIVRQREALRRLARLRQDLTDMVVHDLRTPLAVMLGALETARADVAGDGPAEAGEMIDMALDGTRSLARMVNDLLDIARMEAGESIIQPAETNVDAVVNAAARTVRPLAEAGGIELAVRVQPGIPALWLDGEAIRRAVENLLGNAVKFTPRGGRIEINAAWAGAAQMLTISVSDTGEGIPEPDHERIFDKFGQAESRKRGRKMSTGLGLTFCKMVAESHRGSITLRSEVGEGSTFTMEFPAAQHPPVPSVSTAVSRSPV